MNESAMYMACKKTGQLSLADGLVIQHKFLEELDGLHHLIDWSLIEQVLKTLHNAKKGERAFHAHSYVQSVIATKALWAFRPKTDTR